MQRFLPFARLLHNKPNRNTYLALVATASLAVVGCTAQTITEPVVEEYSSIELLEDVQQNPNKASIAYSKYELENGLTLILAPDDSDPLVHVDVTYHVGSAREELGKSGFAHFFEHMMFQGSKHVGDQEHFRIVTEAGGSLNGTTNRDRTNYYQTVPSNQLEKVLWMEADRMGFLLEAVSQEKFEIQRDTVKNERAQSYDNRPYGLLWEKMDEALYPEGHPYSWQTIGYVEDLDRVTVNDLKAFFLRWYGPNNAVLTIGGDIDVEQVLEWVEKYFSPIPMGPEVTAADKQPATLDKDKFVTLEDKIQQPMLLMAWPTKYAGAEGEESLNVLADIIGNGRNSLLYQELVKPQLALDAGAFHQCSELACNFYVYAMTPSGDQADLEPIYAKLMALINGFEPQSITEERIEQIIGSAEADAIFSLQSVSGKVSMLASNQTFYGDPDRLQSSLYNLRSVTTDSVWSAFENHVQNKPKVSVSVVPQGQNNLAVKEETFVFPTRNYEIETVADELVLRTIVDDFDRAIMPDVQGAVKGRLPELYHFHTSNDIEVLGTQSSETPTVLLQLKIPAGHRYAEEGQEGIASLTANVLVEGSKQSSIEEITAQLDRLGSVIYTDVGLYTTSVTISALEKNLDETLAIVEESLFNPRFALDDFERVKNQMIEGVVYEQQTPTWLASQASRQVLYGDSVYGRSYGGTVDSLQALTLEDVKAFYERYYSPKGSQILVVGDISQKHLKNSLEFLEQWEGESAPILRRQSFEALTSQKIYLVDKPSAPQSVIRLVRHGMPFDATGELYLSQLANFNLGGNFNSRINQNLREDKGYTYGASGYFSSNREIGSVVFDAQVRADATTASVQEFISEMQRYSQEGMTQAEIDFMRLAVGQQDALKYETPGQKAYLLSNILTFSLDHDYLRTRDQIAASVTLEELNEVAAKWFTPNDYQIIVVGDAATLKNSLESLNIPVEVLEISK